MSNDNESGKVTYSDFADSVLGQGEYTPWRGGEDADLIKNTGKDFADIGQGLSSLESLGIKTVGDAMPNVPSVAQIAKGGVNAASHLFAHPEWNRLDGLDKIPDYSPDIHPPKINLPMMGSALANAVVGQPINDYVRPVLHGHLEAPFVNAYRQPVTAFTNAMAFAKPAKAVGNVARAGLNKTSAGTRLLSAIDSSAQLPGSFVKSVADKTVKAAGFGPMKEAWQALAPVVGHLPAEMTNNFRVRRQDITRAYDLIPQQYKDALPAAMSRTDPNAERLIQESPEAMDFIHKVNGYEEDAFQGLKGRGLVGEEDWLKTRVGPQYMAEVAARKWPNPVGARTKLIANDLNNRIVADDVGRFAESKTRAGEPLGHYVPMVSREEAAYHMGRKPYSPLASSRPYDVGAFKARTESGLAKSPAGFQQLSSGKETAQLQNAFITRLEQADRAAALYDWTANFESEFARLSPTARMIVASRVDRILTKALNAVGLSPNDLKNNGISWDLAAIARDNPSTWTHAIQEYSAKVSDVIEHEAFKPLHTGAQVQRLLAVLPDLFFPLYMSVQQSMFLGLQAISGPKAFMRCLIASVLASDKKVLKLFGFSGKTSIASKIVPDEFLERSRVFSNATFDNQILQRFADAVSALSKYQDNTTKAVNYFRTTAAIAWMLEEFESLNPTAKSHVLTTLTEQLNLQRTAQKLLKFGRTLRGGAVKEFRYDAGAIDKQRSVLTKRIQYLNKRIAKSDALMQLAQNTINKGVLVEHNKAMLVKRQQQLADLQKRLESTIREKEQLEVKYKAVNGYRLDGSRYVKYYRESREIGMSGMTKPEVADFMERLHSHLDTFYGDYQAQHTGLPKGLNTAFLWLNMKLHAVRLGYALLNRYAVSGSMVERLAHFVSQQQKAHAQQNDLPAWAARLGCWKSDKKSPDGTMLLYAPHGWFLSTQATSLAQTATSIVSPNSTGLALDEEDLNWLAKTIWLFSGQMPGKNRPLANPDYFRDSEHQYEPAHLHEALRQEGHADLEEDAVAVSWPNFLHRVFQSLLEPASEKLWSYGKSFNRLLYNQEPSDVTIPGLPTYPKRIGGPYGELQQPGPVLMTGLLPGGNKFAPFTTRDDSRTSSFERQRYLKLQKDAYQARDHHAADNNALSNLMQHINSLTPQKPRQQTAPAPTPVQAEMQLSPLDHDALLQQIQQLQPSKPKR